MRLFILLKYNREVDRDDEADRVEATKSKDRIVNGEIAVARRQ